MKVLLIDVGNFKIHSEVTIKNWPHKTDKGLYYDTDVGKVPVAYCFKMISRKIVEAYLTSVKKKLDEAHQFEFDIITKSMRQHRVDQPFLKGD